MVNVLYVQYTYKPLNKWSNLRADQTEMACEYSNMNIIACGILTSSIFIIPMEWNYSSFYANVKFRGEKAINFPNVL